MTSPDPLLYDVGYGSTGALCLAIAVHRLLRILRSPRDRHAAIVCFAFVSTASAFLLATPALYVALDRALGVPDAATLGVYLCILLTSGAFLALLAVWTGRRGGPVVGCVAGYAVLIGVLVVLFVVGHPDDGEHPLDFDARFAADRVLGPFLLVYYAGFAVAMGGIAGMSRHYARMAAPGRPWLARGLLWTARGATFALLYCALKVVAVVGIARGARTQDLSTIWAPLCATVGALLIAAGLSLPGWGPGTAEAARRVLAFRRLYPLWRLLTDAVPPVVLDPATSWWRLPWAGRWALRDTSHRLYRRAVEIHDARLALGPWLDPGDEPTPRQETAIRQDAARREAAMLAGAVRARAAGGPARHEHRAPPELGGEWADELDWLLAVARELRGLRAVPRAVRAPEGSPG